MNLKNLLYDFISLIFPPGCASCGDPLLKNERVLCTRCQLTLPRTGFHLIAGNPAEMVFAGRVVIECGTSCFHFEKGGRMQHLLHQLKYKSRPDVGIELGRILGAEIRTSERFGRVDAIIPVPLHPSREKKRGYNQAECIARGISAAMEVPVWSDILFRNRVTETQTKKSRAERWENVGNAFRIENAQRIEGLHFLLTDDVLTTGATLEACIKTLQETPGVKVSIATLASA